MNYLSTKLSKALNNPSFTNNRRTVSLAPSAASTVIKSPVGDIVVGACHRQQYYKIKGYQPDDGVANIDWTLSAIMGESMHDMLANIIDLYGFQMGLQRIAKEHSIYEPLLKISGRCDLIVWDYINNEPIGIEIKSIGEYKAKKAIESPIPEHVLQSAIYLDFYNKNIPDDQIKITKWYIWYISRTENWTIKSKNHNSDFTMLWDYRVELEQPDGIPIITLTNGSKQLWTDYSIKNIYDRYTKLDDALKTNTLPGRDYEVSYSEERITAMYKAGMLTRKADIEAVEKWLKKGAPIGKLKVELGDSECSFCEYKNTCWKDLTPVDGKKFSNLPNITQVKKSTNKLNIIL